MEFIELGPFSPDRKPAAAESAVRDAMDRLRPRLRWPLLLVDGQGCSYEEAAEVLGCDVDTVAERLYNGRLEVYRRLTSDSDDG